MNELLEQILKRLRPIAEKQHVDLVLESFRPVTAEVDEVEHSHLRSPILLKTGSSIINRTDGYMYHSMRIISSVI